MGKERQREIELNPTFNEGDPTPLCTMECEGRRKKKKDGKSVVVCCLDGKDVEVVPRDVCMPWVRVLVRENGEMLDAVEKAEQTIADVQEAARATEKALEAARADTEFALAEALRLKGELVPMRREHNVLKVQLASAEARVVEAEAEKGEMWKKLKEVQGYASERKKHQARLADINKKWEGANGELLALRGVRFELELEKGRHEDMSKKIEFLLEEVDRLKEKNRKLRTKKFMDTPVDLGSGAMEVRDEKDGG